MKMIIDSDDIYDVQIGDVNIGRNSVGCPEGYSDFEVDVDDVDQDGDITIEISGKCTSFGYHNPMPCTFEGTLTMDEDDFTYEYTNAAEDGAKYIMFEGNIEISLTSGQSIELADGYIEDTFKDTMYNVRREVEEEVEDGYYIINDTVKYIIEEASDKIIEELKRIDNIDDINNAKFADYILENILNNSDYSIKNDKYKSIDVILNDQAAKEIKNGELDEVINDILSDIAEDCSETYKITAKVFFSDLDP